RQGWKSEIFYGLESEEVDRFGDVKLKKVDRLVEWLKSRDAQVVKLLHMALAEDQTFDLGAKLIGEIFERVRGVAGRHMIEVDWNDYPLLSSPASEWRHMSLASLPGATVWQIFAPRAASSLNWNELHQELGLKV
ncbi:MAG: hypothetical protein L7F78_25995, partial [Syntrophales bacterium LBB04]|nr:hypothetical protein [Syntrophales bacterium LBB04]